VSVTGRTGISLSVERRQYRCLNSGQNLTFRSDLPLPAIPPGGSITRPNSAAGHASRLGLHHHPAPRVGPGRLADRPKAPLPNVRVYDTRPPLTLVGLIPSRISHLRRERLPSRSHLQGSQLRVKVEPRAARLLRAQRSAGLTNSGSI